MMEYLEDPDLLPPRCRDPQARRAITDAVKCHQVGAQRAAIVSTWTAVVYDIFAKARELAQAGDPIASDYLKAIDRAIEVHDPKQAQKLESEILTDARDKFALLTGNEYEDLKRLYDDRHRCAHPSFNRPEEMYLPAPELVRLHLRNAVVHLLGQPPVQGRAALEQLQREVDSELFPKTTSDATDYLRGGIYRRMKPALLRNFCIAALVSCLTDADDSQFIRRVRAILALRSLQHDAVNQALREKLTVVARRVPAASFERVLRFVGSISDTYSYLEEDVRLRAQTFVPTAAIPDLFRTIPYALAIADLAISTRARVPELQRTHLEHLLERRAEAEPWPINPAAPEILDRVVELYVESRSWDNSNRMANTLIVPHIDVMSVVQIGRILDGFVNNGELYMSGTRAVVLAIIDASGRAESSQMNAALEKCDMKREELTLG